MRCGTCGEEYERDSGPMICVCTPCLNRPRPPEPFVQVGGIMVPRAAADEARLRSLREMK